MTEPLDVGAFVARQRRLLDLERQAEVDEAAAMLRDLDDGELERRGVLLRRLLLAEQSVGFGGRTVVTLRPGSGDLPAHRIGSGDVVLLRASRGGAASAAVVVAARPDHVAVALDDDDADLPESGLRLERAVPDVTYRRMVAALTRLGDERRDGSALRRAAFGAAVSAPISGDEQDWLDPQLDEPQRRAVAFALAGPPLALVHGPPGTGKTTALVELVRQTVRRGERVLACAPSNVAVDNLVERLAATDTRVLRLGHPARVMPAARAFTIDASLAAAAEPRARRALRRDLDALLRRLRGAAGHAERRRLRADLRALRREARAMDEADLRGVLDSAEVVLATVAGAGDPLLGDRRFPLVVIDEAGQALEAACWIALHRGDRAVLAGDHLQLPPTIVSVEAARQGLAATLFERLIGRHGESLSRMLTVQYRMHATIMAWASTALYDGRLEAAPAVAGHLLADLAGVAATDDTTLPLLLIDTAGCGHDESEGEHDRSKYNTGEADVVVRHVRRLLAAGVPAAAIGVVSPYDAQVQLLRRLLAAESGVEVHSIDGFQGREKEAIVLSLVRSNDRGDVGFLREARRLNVAVTRARRHAALVGDSATLAGDPFLCGLIDHCHARGEVRSAWD